MNLKMESQTEFSGYGYSGICTYIHREALAKVLSWLVQEEQRRNKGGQPPVWSEEIIPEVQVRTGIDHCLHRLKDREVGNLICLGWNPQKITQSVQSMAQLLRILWLMKDEVPNVDRPGEQLTLSIHLSRTSSGYAVGADFSNQVWDIIESPIFATVILPAVNRDMRRWFEEQSNRPVYSQFGMVFNGKDGITLQLYQPIGNGLWIAGSRKKEGEWQMSDHNTDTSFEALTHVVGLCAVLSHCRKHVVAPPNLP